MKWYILRPLRKNPTDDEHCVLLLRPRNGIAHDCTMIWHTEQLKIFSYRYTITPRRSIHLAKCCEIRLRSWDRPPRQTLTSQASPFAPSHQEAQSGRRAQNSWLILLHVHSQNNRRSRTDFSTHRLYEAGHIQIVYPCFQVSHLSISDDKAMLDGYLHAKTWHFIFRVITLSSFRYRSHNTSLDSPDVFFSRSKVCIVENAFVKQYAHKQHQNGLSFNTRWDVHPNRDLIVLSCLPDHYCSRYCLIVGKAFWLLCVAFYEERILWHALFKLKLVV